MITSGSESKGQTTSNDNIKFFSITKYVNFIYSKNKNIEGSDLYFEGSQMFKNKYNQLCIKPVFIKLYEYKGVSYCNHKEIFNMFGCQPIIAFKESANRFMISDKHKHELYYLNIHHEEKEYHDFFYYPSEIFMCSNKNNTANIRSQIIKHEKVYIGNEEDLPSDAF